MSRINSQGRAIPSNYALRDIGPSTFECEGCGRQFSAHTILHYSTANDTWIYSLNLARALRHADACRGG